jgi:hypothetical protein
MRISVPSIPQIVLSPTSSARTITPAVAIERVAAFLAPGNVACITGAGVSVDSGIRAYRGDNGRYLNPNYKCVLFNCVCLGRLDIGGPKTDICEFVCLGDLWAEHSDLSGSFSTRS